MAHLKERGNSILNHVDHFEEDLVHGGSTPKPTLDLTGIMTDQEYIDIKTYERRKLELRNKALVETIYHSYCSDSFEFTNDGNQLAELVFPKVKAKKLLQEYAKCLYDEEADGLLREGKKRKEILDIVERKKNDYEVRARNECKQYIKDFFTGDKNFIQHVENVFNPKKECKPVDQWYRKLPKEEKLIHGIDHPNGLQLIKQKLESEKEKQAQVEKKEHDKFRKTM